MGETEDLRGFEGRLLLELRQVVRERGEATSTRPKSISQVLPVRGGHGRRWALAASVVVVAVLALSMGPTIFTPRGSGSSAFAVDVLEDGRIHVRVAADFDEGARLQERLREEGVKAQVIPVKSHPALVGTIEFPQHQLRSDGIDRGKGEFWIDPERFRGTVEVLVHTATRPGEEWSQAPSVFHPDEPLGGLPCVLEGPMDTALLESYARSVGITRFAWSLLEGDPRGSSRGVKQRAARPDGEVEHAERVAPDKIRVAVRPPDAIKRYGHALRPSMNLNVHESPEPPCTADLTARWRRG